MSGLRIPKVINSSPEKGSDLVYDWLICDFDTKVTHSIEFCNPRPFIYLSTALLGDLFAFWNLIASSNLGGSSKYFFILGHLCFFFVFLFFCLDLCLKL